MIRYPRGGPSTATRNRRQVASRRAPNLKITPPTHIWDLSRSVNVGFCASFVYKFFVLLRRVVLFFLFFCFSQKLWMGQLFDTLGGVHD